MVNDNFVYRNMSFTFFFGNKLLFFWRHTLRHQISHLWNTTSTSLEHNYPIFVTQLPHLGTQPSHLSSYQSVTGNLPNNLTMLPPFSFFMNFHPKLSDSCSGLIVRLEQSQCCYLNGHSVVIRLPSTRPARCVLRMWRLCSKDVAVVLQRCDSCVL